MNDDTDTLFRRAREGDPDAYWSLVAPHRGLIFSVAYSMLKDREQAEDLLQEVMLTGARSIGSLRDPRRLPSWLHSMTRNHVLDTIRRDQRRRRTMIGAARESARVVAIADGDDRETRLAAMEAAMLDLPEPFRIILGLKYMNRFSCAEIASTLEISISAVKSRLFEARKLLRRRIEAAADAREARHHGTR